MHASYEPVPKRLKLKKKQRIKQSRNRLNNLSDTLYSQHKNNRQ